MKFLIVGLGNIGEEYSNTRHNIGFDVLDFFAKEKEISFEAARYADKARIKIKNREFICIKPSTYMNLSGKAVLYWMNEEKIPLDRILIITDDVALPLGKLRLKAKGSDGGHNGLKNIQELLGSQQYARLRFGIGNDYPKGAQVHFVLGKWQDEEFKEIQDRIPLACEMIESFAFQGVHETMNKYNNK